MREIRIALTNGNDVFLRGFGSFNVKHRAEKTGRNIGKNTLLIIPAHNAPVFKASKEFVVEVKNGKNK